MIRIKATVARIDPGCAVLMLDSAIDDGYRNSVELAVRDPALLARFRLGETWNVFLEPEITEKTRRARAERWMRRTQGKG